VAIVNCYTQIGICHPCSLLDIQREALSGENTRRLANTRCCFTSVEPIYLLNALLGDASTIRLELERLVHLHNVWSPAAVGAAASTSTVHTSLIWRILAVLALCTYYIFPPQQASTCSRATPLSCEPG
jgi:hypothetical protein